MRQLGRTTAELRCVLPTNCSALTGKCKRKKPLVRSSRRCFAVHLVYVLDLPGSLLEALSKWWSYQSREKSQSGPSAYEWERPLD